MEYLIGIGFVNRPDLLRKAIDSIRPYWKHALVIDNSDNRGLRSEEWLRDRVQIYEPDVPLTFPQMMNLLQKKAEQKGCDIVMFMHNDAEAHPGTPERFLEEIERFRREGRKWGVAFTNYDYLVAFNMEAIRRVGRWDTNLPGYYTDCEYYYRMRLAGYECIWTHLPLTHYNNGGTTVRSDPYRLKHWEATIKLYHQYYEMKWGEPGNERFTKPFNR